MIIGVDAGALSITDERLRVGVYRVVDNFLERLGLLDKGNKYYLYSFAPLPPTFLKKVSRVMINKVLSPRFGWFSLRLPLELLCNPVDIFLGVSQTLPIVSSPCSIGFVYDLGFLRYPGAYPDSLQRLQRQTQDLVKRSKHIITISQSSKRDIQRFFGVPSAYISVLYPGVDKHFTPFGEVQRAEHPYFLFVGALKRIKNIPTILRAFARFCKNLKKKHDLILVGGDYWIDPEILNSVRALGIQDRVRFVGFVSDQELPLYYRGAVALVSPSLWEGFCLPAVEAMACGCPVIGSTRGSFPEVVGSSGILVDPEQDKELYDAMMVMALGKKQRKKCKEYGIERSKDFTWDAFAKGVLNVMTTKGH